MSEPVVSTVAPEVVTADSNQSTKAETAGPADTQANDQVDLKVWAKTSSENRALKAKVKEFESKVKEYETKLAASPDEKTRLEKYLVEQIKQPGFAKRLIAEGRTFDDVIAELTDVQTVDPELVKANERIDKLESERKAEAEAKAKADEEAKSKQSAAWAEDARNEIAKFAKEDTTEITDEKDVRFGTNRWAVVSERPDLVETARSEVTSWIQKNRPEGVTSDEAQSLVTQALDQLEIAERTKLLPVLNKLRPANQNTKAVTKETRSITEDKNPFQLRQSTITGDLKGPPPTSNKRGRYAGGPRKITYTDVG